MSLRTSCDVSYSPTFVFIQKRDKDKEELQKKNSFIQEMRLKTIERLKEFKKVCAIEFHLIFHLLQVILVSTNCSSSILFI